MMDGEELNYRTDEQFRAILVRSGKCAPTIPLEQILCSSVSLRTVIRLVHDPAEIEQLKKIMAGFDLPPIKEPSGGW
jgi:hypothetical protein